MKYTIYKVSKKCITKLLINQQSIYKADDKYLK